VVAVTATQVRCGVFVEALGHAIGVLLLDPFDEFGEGAHAVESLSDFLGSFLGFPSAEVLAGLALGFALSVINMAVHCDRCVSSHSMKMVHAHVQLDRGGGPLPHYMHDSSVTTQDCVQ